MAGCSSPAAGDKALAALSDGLLRTVEGTVVEGPPPPEQPASRVNRRLASIAAASPAIFLRAPGRTAEDVIVVALPLRGYCGLPYSMPQPVARVSFGSGRLPDSRARTAS